MQLAVHLRTDYYDPIPNSNHQIIHLGLELGILFAFAEPPSLQHRRKVKGFTAYSEWRQDALEEEAEGAPSHDTIRHVDEWCHSREVDTVTGPWPTCFSASACPELLAYN